MCFTLWEGLKRRPDGMGNATFLEPCYNSIMLHIPLPPDTEETLRERAKANGEDVASYAARLLHEALSTPSVDELLAPFRKQVEESGISDAELDQFGETLQREVRQDKQARKAKTA